MSVIKGFGLCVGAMKCLRLNAASSTGAAYRLHGVHVYIFSFPVGIPYTVSTRHIFTSISAKAQVLGGGLCCIVWGCCSSNGDMCVRVDWRLHQVGCLIIRNRNFARMHTKLTNLCGAPILIDLEVLTHQLYEPRPAMC